MTKKCWNIKAKNIEQEQALEALLDPTVDLVILEGLAGSGKTLMALAAGLEQVIERKLYGEIIFTRAAVNIGEDLGFLPGTEEEKMGPWCGALVDNMEVLLNEQSIKDIYIATKIKIKAIQFMRGRSFNKKYIIIDEVQNIDKEHLKVLLSRAGEGCKIVCLGDCRQVDKKSLNTDYNGMQYLCQTLEEAEEVDFIKLVRLPVGVRSRLASWVTYYL